MYIPTFWQDHVITPPNHYTITDNHDGTYTILPSGEVMQQGTPQDQAHFNNMENGILDASLAVGLLANAVRQNLWVIQRGTVELTNTLQFPFNNSAKTVALTSGVESPAYVVVVDVVKSTGNVGEVEVTNQLANGFKIGFTGSAPSATVSYTVIGGYLK